jgi:UDP-N-acetylglucosamine--N-acetylmuramyl-(pentapeptide) pyrophosphoryl-undecaprenol N-acetylglucosamine transferase
MMKVNKNPKIIISGGGTGGHVFPAIAIANALKLKNSNCEILFVGAKGKMEMEVVPAAGYKITGLPVRGFQRKISLRLFITIYKLFVSLLKARKIINNFNPDVVVGVGGYASGPMLKIATQKNIPTLIQEQNSFAGITNKLLSKKVNKICVAYDGMDRFFPEQKIVFTGNPVRQDINNVDDKYEEAINYFHLNKNCKTILVLGGSLGARTINQSVAKGLNLLTVSNLNVLWQTGKEYYETAKDTLKQKGDSNIKIHDFISRMDLAYSVADVVISRAGASTVSELCIVKKPAILVPSPNVAEDHQTKNAMALVTKKAAIMVKDSEAEKYLIEKTIDLINNKEDKKMYAENIAGMAIYNSAGLIADEILKLI